MLQCSGNGDGVGLVCVTLREELCEVPCVRKVRDRMMVDVLAYEEDEVRLIYLCTPQSGRSLDEKAEERLTELKKLFK